MVVFYLEEWKPDKETGIDNKGLLNVLCLEKDVEFMGKKICCAKKLGFEEKSRQGG